MFRITRKYVPGKWWVYYYNETISIGNKRTFQQSGRFINPDDFLGNQTVRINEALLYTDL